MSTKFFFSLAQYAWLLSILVACWGAGRSILGQWGMRSTQPPGLLVALEATLGLGLAICALQGLAITGHFRPVAVAAFWAAGLLMAGWHLRASLRAVKPHPRAAGWPPRSAEETFAWCCLALVLATTLLRPLAPPMEWDELMYHLPHAQQWAISGELRVNDWLRYPWFPYNYDLLYAAALLWDNDVLPHLLHAAAGWMITWLVYALGARHVNTTAGIVAATLWLLLSKSEYNKAYVDMGVTLFVFTAAIAFEQWRGSRNRRWLLASAFLLGVAVGSKYQVLSLLPFFACALLLQDRRPSTWLLVASGLALPCAYWYARNAMLTGDPFNPIGGRVFGFSDWNLDDYNAQFADLKRVAAFPPWFLWPALAAPWIPALRRSAEARSAMYLSAWMLLVWLLSSRYPRYLMPAYPFLVLLVVATGRSLLHHLPASLARAKSAAAALALLSLAAFSATSIYKHWGRIAPTAASREALLRKEVDGYTMWRGLRDRPLGRVYQMGLEGTLYYAPQPVWGEVFGPWRYSDVLRLSTPDMHDKLWTQNFRVLALHTGYLPGVASRPDFDTRFELLQVDGKVRLYRLRPPVAP